MDVSAWLRNLGLERYAPAFRENEITAEVLPELTDADLRELGLPLGPRKVLLKAITALRTPSAVSSDAQADPAAGASRKPRDPGSAEPQAERRQLTVMFCDLIGSTALSVRLDPEDLREVIGAYHRCVDDVVGQGDGFVAQYLGDGALVYFGYPQAHEHDAERAIRAGLALVDAVGRLDTAAGHLRTRIGIATGLVVVGDPMRSGSAQERGVVGRTPNLAARLQAIAEPDTVVIDTGTRRLTGGLFDYAELGTVTAKGFAEPLQAWRVLDESTVASRFEALRTGATSLVGREEELALLLRSWEQARSGEGRVVLLSGEPGIGKSRLVAALEEKVAAEPLSKHRCFCSPYHANSALFPVIVRLERAAAFEQSDSPEAKLGKLETLLEPTSASAEDVGLLAGLLSLPADRYGLAPDLSPEHRKDKILQALLRQQRQLSKSRPVLMLFEDVHWIDPTSRQLLDLMVEQAARLPVLVLITCRPEFQPSWQEQAHVRSVPLHRLQRHEGAALVEEVAGNHALPDDIVTEILDRADGIPLFVEELTKAVLETAGSANGAATVLSAVPAKAHAVPVTLHASLISRLDRLVPDAKAVAQTGAAIGREFSYVLLAAAAGIEPGSLERGLAQLIDAGLIFQRGVPPDAVYAFKHALVQDVAYSTLLRGPRRALHARIAQALQQDLPETAEVQPELLARHFAEAGLTQEAVRHWRIAGERSLARSARAEAAVQFGAAIHLLDDIPDGPERRAQSIDLHLSLGQALRAAKGIAWPETTESFRIAYDLSVAQGDTERLPQALYGLLLSHLNRAELRIAERLAIDLQTFARGAKDAGALVRGHEIRGMVLFGLGELNAASREFEVAISAVDTGSGGATELSATVSRDPNGFVYLALALFVLGFPDMAQARLRQGLAVAAAAPPVVAGFTWHNACYLHLLEGDWQAAKDRAEAMISWAAEKGIPVLSLYGKLFLGCALAELGRSEEGAALTADFVVRVRGEVWVRIEMPYQLGLIARVHLRAGQPALALESLDEALSMIERTEERWFEAELHRLRGECALHEDTVPAAGRAEKCFQQALAVARAQGALMWELRAATSLGRIWRHQGRHAEARALLVPIFGRFTEGFETSDVREAKALLDTV